MRTTYSERKFDTLKAAQHLIRTFSFCTVTTEIRGRHWSGRSQLQLYHLFKEYALDYKHKKGTSILLKELFSQQTGLAELKAQHRVNFRCFTPKRPWNLPRIASNSDDRNRRTGDTDESGNILDNDTEKTQKQASSWTVGALDAVAALWYNAC